MASTSIFKQKLEFEMNTAGADKALSRLTNKLQSYTSNVNKAATGSNKQNQALQKLSDQGIFNIQAGLVQLSTYSMILNQKINNLFDTMGNSYRKAETGITRLKIKLGDIAGENPTNEVKKRSQDAQDAIKKIAATTMFTVPEVASAMDTLSSGINGFKNQLGALSPALRYVASSAGKVSLDEGIETAVLATTNLGVKVEDLSTFFDDLISVSRTTTVNMEDYRETLVGLKGAIGNFDKDTKNSSIALLALSAAMSTSGKRGREAGDAVNQLARASNNLIKVAERAEFRGRGRKSSAHKAMLQMFGLVDNAGRPLNISADFKKFLGKNINQAEKVVARMQKKGTQYTAQKNQGADFIANQMDKFVLSKLFTEEGKQLGTDQYVKTMFTLYQNILNNPKLKKKRTLIINQAFGSKAASGALLSLDSQIRKTLELGNKSMSKYMEENDLKNYGQVYDRFIETVRSKGGEAAKAQKASLDTLQGKTYLLESAYDALYQTLMEKDVYGKDALDIHKQVVGVMDDVIKRSPDLGSAILVFGRSAQMFSGFATNAGFALTAVATFSMALQHSTKVTGRSVTTLGGLLGSFRTIFLAPAFRVLTLLGGGFAIAGIAAAGFMKHFTGKDQTFLQAFKTKIKAIKDEIIVVRNAIKIGGDKDIIGTGNDTKTPVKVMLDINDQYQKSLKYMKEMDRLRAKKDKTAEEITKLKQLNKQFEKLTTFQKDKTKNLAYYSDRLGSDVVDSIGKKSVADLERLNTYANTINKLKESFMAFASSFSAVFNPMIRGIVASMNAIGAVLMLPIRLISYMFGLADGGNALISVFGGIVGAIVGIKLIVGTISFIFGTVVSMKTSLINKALHYNGILQQTVNTQRTIGLAINTNYRNQFPGVKTKTVELNILQKMRLEYYNMTNQTDKRTALEAKYRQELMLTHGQLKRNAATGNLQAPGVGDKLGKMSKAGVLGATLMGASTVLAMGGTSWFGEWGETLMTVMFALSAIIPLWGSFSTIFAGAGAVMLGVFGLVLGKILLIAGVIGSVLWALGAFDSANATTLKTEPKTNKPRASLQPGSGSFKGKQENKLVVNTNFNGPVNQQDVDDLTQSSILGARNTFQPSVLDEWRG